MTGMKASILQGLSSRLSSADAGNLLSNKSDSQAGVAGLAIEIGFMWGKPKVKVNLTLLVG